MIQRIQTPYLTLVSVLLVVTLSAVLVTFSSPGDTLLLSSMHLENATGEIIFSTIPVSLLLFISLVLSTITIFLYKRRVLQIRLSIYNIILNLGYYILIGYYIFQVKKEFVSTMSIEIFNALPLINVILLWLAIRKIGADEALVRSVDRIR